MYGSQMKAEFERAGRKQGPISLELCAPKDEAAVVKEATGWINDNRVRMFLSLGTAHTESYEAEWIKKGNTDDSYHWRIYADGVHIGGCGLHAISKEDRNAEIGLMIGESTFWGKGIATVAEIMVTEFAFANIVAEGLHKVIARVFVSEDGRGNDASRAAITKAGYREVGICREQKWLMGRWYDVWNCEVLASEWRDERLERMEKTGIKKLDLYPGCEHKGFAPILIE